MTRACLQNSGNENYQLTITHLLREGNVRLAFHIFLAAANKIKNPCSLAILTSLLAKIDADFQKRGFEPIPENAGQIMTENELTFKTSNKIENALSYFVKKVPGSAEIYTLDVHALRILRLYESFGEPKPASTTAQEIASYRPNLCLVHIHA